MKVFLATLGVLATANLYACATQSYPVVADTESAETQTPRTEVLTEAESVESQGGNLADLPTSTTPEQRFTAWKSGFIDRMSRRYDPALVQSVVGPAELQPQLLESDENQPEFTRPIWGYLDSALKESRVAPGQESLRVYAPTFEAIEARYRVPREVLTAIWGMESQYGTFMGDNPVVSALATFAFEGRRSEMFTEQLEALVQLVAEGKLKPDDLYGSWAGAMGMTQFMPATMRDYAVDFDGNGVIELRTSEADALGSAAHYLSRFGWVPGEPAFIEVMLPQGFDYALADGSTKRAVSEYERLGVAPVRGTSTGSLFAPTLASSEAKLLLPAGARGPAFLTLKNFDVIKRYNNSTSYALGVAGLAKTFEGEIPVLREWPRDDQPLSFTEKKQLQERLLQLGFDPSGVDGVIGPGTRKAIRAWQAANGLPADGYVEQNLFRRIMGLG